MPLERHRAVPLVAAVLGDLLPGPGGEPARVRAALAYVNQAFGRALAEPFTLVGERLDGVLADPAQTPLCLTVLREQLAPRLLRVGVGVGRVGAPPGPDGRPRDPYALAREALALAARDEGLTRYLGTGAAGDVLLSALCRLVDPLLRERTPKQWEAIRAYRELGHQRAVAARLGVTRQSVGDRLAAGHRRAVDEADAAVAAYLSWLQSPRRPAAEPPA